MATIPEALAAAIDHHQGGRLQAAQQIYRRILAAEPNHAEALHLLGLIAYQAGNPDEAAACWRRTVELAPEFAQAHYNLGIAYKDQGKLDAAIACWRRALELQPGNAATLNNLGNVLREQGKHDEAIACYRRALEFEPESARHHFNLANALRDQGKLDEAITSFGRAIELEPDYVEAHSNLGNALRQQGRIDEAIACWRRTVELRPDFSEAHYNLSVAYTDQGKFAEAVACCRRAVELKPDFAEAYNNLGNALRELGSLDEAAACCRKSLGLRPDLVDAHNNLGNALMDQGKLEEAAACYRRAVELSPDFAKSHFNLGIVCEQSGDLAGAEDCFRAALRRNPRFALAHYNLDMLLRGKLQAEDLAAQRRLLAEKDLPDSERLLLHFGLALVLDSLGEYVAAAEHLEHANSLQLAAWRRRGREYAPQEHALLVARMIEATTPDFFARVRDFGLESEVPVFVVGLPRSGTTLIEQILASHSQVFGGGELPFALDTLTALGEREADFIDGLRRIDLQTAQRLAARHLERLRGLHGTALRIVDKLPENYLYLGMLAALFPRARFIHCRRDLRDVAVSCWMTHFQQLRWANDPQHIASRFLAYQRIMAHWRQVLPVSMLEVDYEATVAGLEGVARRLVAWCGLEWEPSCLDFHQGKRTVSTASAVQVRQPVYQTSVERWRHYEQPLASLFAQIQSPIGERMKS
jgi:tetratricopeptide (TPR) repeat protein